MFRTLPLKAVYRSEDDNILEDFYLPALQGAVAYDRAVGYFSASMLSYAAQGISALVENNGYMRLIIGGELDPQDAAAINSGYDTRALVAKLGETFSTMLENISDGLFYKRVEALSWLVASGRLDIKLAFKQQGMYHEKIGIMTDAEGDKIIFQGSANETTNALLPDFNFESINVFQGWRPELSEHFEPYVTGFEKLWTNNSRNTLVLDFPDAAKERMVRIAQHSKPPNPRVEADLWERLTRGPEPADAPTESQPLIPASFNGNDFEIMPHQRDALAAWKAHDFQGIFALATGAGKTITSIYGAVKVYEATKKLFVVIAVPYTNLADQWVETLRDFNIVAIRCYGSSTQWAEDLSRCLTLYQTNALTFVCLVVVNRTLQSERFQAFLSQIPGDKLLWIGDECHHHSSEGLARALPNHAKRRIGLSATPEHYMNDGATARLKAYYGPIVSSYSLADALKHRVLTPYAYHVVVVDLTPTETEEYAALSDQIGRLAARKAGGNLESSEDGQLKMLLFKRARILGAAANKLPALQELLCNVTPNKHTLFYCGDGRTEEEDSQEPVRQIEAVSRLVGKLGWRNSHFTSRETRDERQRILDNFRLGFIDAMVAIRCLDEGIDVPACRSAYILASSRNPKQFIQRRGRILRRSPGKEQAEIFDFVVQIPSEISSDSPHERALLSGELSRVSEFGKLALNSGEVYRTLEPLLDQYDLHHML